MSKTVPEVVSVETAPDSIPWFFHDSDAQLDDPNAPLPMPAMGVSATSLLTYPEEATVAAAVAAGKKHPLTSDQAPSKTDNENLQDKLPSNVSEDVERGKAGTPDLTAPARLKFTVTSAYVGSVSPSTDWYAFNPSDTKHLELEYEKNRQSETAVLVGLNRLFQVSLATKTLQPTYWAPVGQVPNVHRAEWFYSSTLTPTDPVLENLVAEAFDQIKPWTSRYVSELASALDVPEAINKFRLPITYEENGKETKYFLVFAPCQSIERKKILEEQRLMEAQDGAEAADQSTELSDSKPSSVKDLKSRDSSSTLRSSPDPPSKKLDVKDTPDRGRSPARTFLSDPAKSPDSAKSPDPAKSPDSAKSPESTKIKKPVSPYKEYPIAYLFSPPTINIPYFTGAPTPQQLVNALLNGKTPSGAIFTLQRHFSWPDYKKIKGMTRPRPTDDSEFEPEPIKELILVFHGIGQKLSERVESFNFTYAINSFRILVNEQLDQPGVEHYCTGHKPGSVMVLPINWRRTVDFEKLKRPSSDNLGDTSNLYSLEDITVKSIPAVRNLISDVMLDIPYYMSRYKPYLVEAAAKEANRVYNLFVQNNPGFDGNVNTIGHSLGSMICTDILSNQKTDVNRVETPRLKPSLTRESAIVSEESRFDFNTKNLFFCGSPVGFFLLMEGNQLYPRKLLDEPKTQATSTYGCMAIDNIYNVLHHSDPIAYLLNPTVDAHLANNVWETATLPNEKLFPKLEVHGPANAGFFDTLASKLPPMPAMPAMPTIPTFRTAEVKTDGQVAAEMLEAMDLQAAEATGEVEMEDAPLLDESNVVEMEDRDFKREYAGEERMKLLNDNGQIDWVIPLTGTLENQYISMITAHSGYWDNRDFARLVAIECTRTKGEGGALEQYAVKKKKKI